MAESLPARDDDETECGWRPLRAVEALHDGRGQPAGGEDDG